MQEILRVAFSQGMALGVTGLLAGAVSGWISLIMADGAEAVATIEARIYLGLTLLFPVLLWLMNLAPDSEERKKYTPLSSALTLLLVAAIIGSIVGSVFFLVTGTNIPGAFGGEDPIKLSQALKQQIAWGKFAIVFGVTILSALGIAFSTHQQAKKALTDA